MIRSYSASWSMIRCRSSAASRRSCMSKIAFACRSSISSSCLSPSRASSVLGLRRIERDHLVQSVEGLDQTAVDVGTGLGVVQPVLGTPRMTSIWWVIQ